MGVFDRQVATALRLISEKGQTVTWVKKANPVFADPNKPWIKTDGSDVSYSVKVVFFPIYRDLKENQAVMDYTRREVGAEMCFMGQVSFNPELSDILIRDGVSLIVKNIDTIRPNGEVILHEIEFEK